MIGRWQSSPNSERGRERERGGQKRLIGIGRLIIEPDFRKGEFAVVIHDDFQSKGLGYKLVDMIIGIAQEKGLKEIYGIVLTDNTRMLTLCKRLGFHIAHLPDGISRVNLALR